MKRIPLLIAALVPFMAAAGGAGQKAQVDQEKLRGAVPATKIIGQDVETRDGREFGEVESIVFKKDGSVAYYGIEPDMDMYTESGVQEQEAAVAPSSDAATSMSGGAANVASSSNVGADREAMAGSEEAAEQASAEGATVGGSGDDLIHVKPQDIRFEQNGDVVTINKDGQSLMKQRGTTSSTETGDELEASEVIGMQVDLADEESFGEVEDIMLSQKGDKAVALVVDNWDGVDKERRALPVELESADREEDVIRYQLSKDELDKAGDFDLDQYTDET